MDAFLPPLDNIEFIPSELKDQLLKIMDLREYQRKAFLIMPGKVNAQIFYVTSGLIRSYTLRQRRDFDKEEEINRSFYFTGDFVGSLNRYHKQLPENQYYQALKPTSVLITTIDRFEAVLKKFDDVFDFGHGIWCKNEEKNEKIQDMLRLPTTAEKYKFLKENFPKISDQVPKAYLASFLGVDSATLSRRNLFKRK